MDAFSPDGSVVIYSLPPKVGDTIRVLIHDEDGNEVNPADVGATVGWSIGTVPAYATATTLTVPDWAKAGDIIKADVLIGDKTYTASAVVTADKAAEIKLIDKNGLQSDGTALPTDTLTVSYGQDLGTPSTVIWWCDGVVKAVYTTEGGGLLAAFTSTAIQDLDTVPPIKELDEGEWWVTIENTEGVTSTTNVITVAESHIAIIEDVTITDDYATDGAANLDIAKTTTKSVVTVTLNKEYVGDFYLAHEKATKFSKTDLKHAIDVSTAVPVTSLSKFTDAAAITQFTTNQKAISYLDKKTGEITYKFPVKMAAAATDDIKRGDSYYLIFDQDGFDFDDMPATDSADFEDLNASDLVEVPYLEAPDSIEVTSYSNGGKTVKVTMYNEDGEELAWWDSTTAASVNDTKGISDVNVYYTASNTAAASDTAATLAATPITIKDGVLSATTADPSNKNYAYAKISFTAGIFDAEEITLTTAVKETNEKPATSFTLGESSSDPKAAEIKFENLKGRASGTVYVFQGNATLAGTAGKSNAKASDLVAQEKNGPWMVGSAAVEGGETKVIIENVFNKNQMTDANEKYFAALFVPDDDEYYASMTTDADNTTGDLDSFELKQQLKSYKLKSPIEKKTIAQINALTDPVIVGVDQFGQDITLNATNGKALVLAYEVPEVAFTNTATKKAGAGKISTAIADTGTLTITSTAAATNNATAPDFVAGTTYERTIAGGQKLKIVVASDGDKAAGTVQTAAATFTVTIE